MAEEYPIPTLMPMESVAPEHVNNSESNEPEPKKATVLTPTEVQKATDLGLLNNPDFDVYRGVTPIKRAEHLRTLIAYLDPTNNDGLREEILKYANGSGRYLILGEGTGCNYTNIGGGYTWAFYFSILGGIKHTSTFESYDDLVSAFNTTKESENAKVEKVKLSVSAFKNGTASKIMAKILAFYTYIYEEDIPSVDDGGAGGASGGVSGAPVAGGSEESSSTTKLRSIWTGFFYTSHSISSGKLTHKFDIRVGETRVSIVLNEDTDFDLSEPDSEGNFTVAYRQERVLKKVSNAMHHEAERLTRLADESTEFAVRRSGEAAAARRRAERAQANMTEAMERGDREAIERARETYTLFSQASETAEREATDATELSVGYIRSSEDMRETSELTATRSDNISSGTEARMAAIPTRALSEGVRPVAPPAPPSMPRSSRGPLAPFGSLSGQRQNTVRAGGFSFRTSEHGPRPRLDVPYVPRMSSSSSSSLRPEESVDTEPDSDSMV